MIQVNISANWHPAELCINMIHTAMKPKMESRKLKTREILGYVFLDISDDDVTMENIWYGTYDHLTHMENWERGINIADYAGLSFLNQDEIQIVLSDRHDSKKIDIFVEGIDYRIKPNRANCIFHKMMQPKLKTDELAVYHGGTSSMEVVFDLEIDGPFDARQLAFNFVDCGKYGLILNTITYNDIEMEKDYSPFKDTFFNLEFIDADSENSM